ncbi:adenylate kinase [Pancytospora epiphaga]|nr:adenylate kinase [Pancytospora epiphaga]
MKLLVTGTPGVGKSTFSRLVSEEFGCIHVDVTEYIKKHELYEKYDKVFDTLIFDEKKVRRHLKAFLREFDSYIIDTHSPGVCRSIKFDTIFQLRCNTKVLAERLEARKYSELKITENLDCECLDMVGEELDDVFGVVPIYVNGCNTEDVDTEMDSLEAISFLKSKNISN